MWLYNHNRLTGTVWAEEGKKQYLITLEDKKIAPADGKAMPKKVSDAILAELAIFEVACKNGTKYLNPSERPGVQ